jgi:hypothetical protein
LEGTGEERKEKRAKSKIDKTPFLSSLVKPLRDLHVLCGEFPLGLGLQSRE